MFKKINDDWQQINDDINYVQHKNNRFKTTKLLTLLSALFLSLTAVTTGGYFFIESMVKALNFSDFKTPDVDLEGIDFQVNMALVPIVASEDNLRLKYFEDTLKMKAFNYLKTLPWWNLFFVSNPDDFDFTWFKPNSDDKLESADIAKDGIDPCDLQLTVKNSGYSFKVHVGSFVYNTSKFYENFMVFNRFETEYDLVNPNFNPIVNHIANKGYLSQSYSVAVTSSTTSINSEVYKWIEDRINLFCQNESQEMVNNSLNPVMYPILTSLTHLPDIDLNDDRTLIPYMLLITNPMNYYYGNQSNPNFKKLNNNNKYFTIIYSPIPDLIEKIRAAGITNPNQLDTFLINSKLNFVPFVANNQAEVTGQGFKKFDTRHNLIFQKDFATRELTNYIYCASNTMNINDFKVKIPDNLSTVGALNYWLTKYQVSLWIFNAFIKCEKEIDLLFPAVSAPYPNTSEGRFNYFAQDSSAFKGRIQSYFIDTKLVGPTFFNPKIVYYDNENHALTLAPSANIPYSSIKHVLISIGPDIVDPTIVRNGAQSFSFFLKTI